MTVSDDELLRLARKAFPCAHSERVEIHPRPLRVVVHSDDCSETVLEVDHPARGHAALHAALTVLAGEEHAQNAELGAALDTIADLRDRLDRALLDGEQHRAARGHAVNTTQLLTSLLERSIAAHMRHGQGDLARELSEALKKAIER